MADKLGERVARLEAERDQHRKELDRLARVEKKLDRLCLSVESLIAWRRRRQEHWLWAARQTFYAGLLIGAELVSGVWGRVFGALAKAFA